MKKRMLAVLLALPLVAFDCGGKEQSVNPFGLGCTVHVSGAVPSEDLWCIVTAYDFSAFPDPQYAQTSWVFEIVGYRTSSFEIGAGGGLVLAGRPVVPTYSWNGSSASGAIVSGGFNRYSSMTPGPYEITHANSTLGNGSFGEGSFSVTFTEIPPANATNEELLGVHGSFTATLPPLEGVGDVTLTARF